MDQGHEPRPLRPTLASNGEVILLETNTLTPISKKPARFFSGRLFRSILSEGKGRNISKLVRFLQESTVMLLSEP